MTNEQNMPLMLPPRQPCVFESIALEDSARLRDLVKPLIDERAIGADVPTLMYDTEDGALEVWRLLHSPQGAKMMKQLLDHARERGVSIDFARQDLTQLVDDSR